MENEEAEITTATITVNSHSNLLLLSFFMMFSLESCMAKGNKQTSDEAFKKC